VEGRVLARRDKAAPLIWHFITTLCHGNGNAFYEFAFPAINDYHYYCKIMGE